MLSTFIEENRDFESYIQETTQIIEHSRLAKAMHYSLSNGGKRVRPLLTLATVYVLGGDVKNAYPIASAIEYIHTYSLIHDDLPAMDNDDYRRGQLTSHKQFDEPTAILAGDALLTHAFGLIVGSVYTSDQKVKMIDQLVRCSGGNGMIGGQMNDIMAQGQSSTLEAVQHIHALKTGALLQSCVRIGAIAVNADEYIYEQLDKFAYHFGLAFQIHNDIKDITQDEALEKSTYVAILGKQGAIDALEKEKQCALDALEAIKGYDTQLLASFLTYLR
ncbi:polyprenyl synthetase family protein [Carnobacteriaceae bacterium zg-C25]|nr:polyprenyl synthetase family protein [Carnobacteriaceae bacterium zg-C25]